MTLRASWLCAAVATLLACSVDGPLPSNGCPCAAAFSCRIQARTCFQTDAGPVERLGCIVYTDGKLYCTNRSGIAMFAEPSAAAPVVNHLVSTWSWFICWTAAERQPDGSTTWLFTDGDVRGAPNAWLPVANVDTPLDFNADPAAYGFAACARS